MKNVLVAVLSTLLFLTSPYVAAGSPLDDAFPPWRSDWQQSTKNWLETHTRDLDVGEGDGETDAEADLPKEVAERLKREESELEFRKHHEALLREVQKFADELASEKHGPIETLLPESEERQLTPGTANGRLISFAQPHQQAGSTEEDDAQPDLSH